jgi:hypothetical protein
LEEEMPFSDWKRIEFPILGFLLASLLISVGEVMADGPSVIGENLTFEGFDFLPGKSYGIRVGAYGLQLGGVSMGLYTSQVISAPIPFTDVGPHWESSLPEGSHIELEIRTSADGESWSLWQRVYKDCGEEGEEEEHFGRLIFVPQAEGVHRYLQFRVFMSSSPTGDEPRLSSITFAFIDSRGGPSTSEIMKARSHALGIAKPAVISRSEWGCPDGQESPNWPPEYESVTHIIIHHTATPNSDTDWAARVRSIWYYHALERGWGDIGYNLLIDPLGNIYEGRAGGDDVIGRHTSSFNSGTLGLAFLGTYSSSSVPSTMQSKTTELMAWECDFKKIDPLGSGYKNEKEIPNISGHRDVNLTLCPGDSLYALLPTLREEVQELLEASRTIIVDELDSGFLKSDADYWYDYPEGCGYEEHAWWTYSITNPNLSTNWGIWRPNLPLDGFYKVYAYVPHCTNGVPDTESAKYVVHHARGKTEVIVNQKEVAGDWAYLGNFPFEAGEGYVYLDDITDDICDKWYCNTVWFDAVKWVRQEVLLFFYLPLIIKGF